MSDLLDHPLPPLGEPIPAGKDTGEHAKAWAATVAEFDGFVSCGSPGGARAHVRRQLSCSLLDDLRNFTTFTLTAAHDQAATILFGRLESWAGARKTVRS